MSSLKQRPVRSDRLWLLEWERHSLRRVTQGSPEGDARAGSKCLSLLRRLGYVYLEARWTIGNLGHGMPCPYTFRCPVDVQQEWLYPPALGSPR